jgi:hypothetical protein
LFPYLPDIIRQIFPLPKSLPEHVPKIKLLAERLVNTNFFLRPYIYHQNGLLATENNVEYFRPSG